jgi:hypothetical protein
LISVSWVDGIIGMSQCPAKMCVCISVCLSIYLSIYLSICLIHTHTYTHTDLEKISLELFYTVDQWFLGGRKVSGEMFFIVMTRGWGYATGCSQ